MSLEFAVSLYLDEAPSLRGEAMRRIRGLRTGKIFKNAGDIVQKRKGGVDISLARVFEIDGLVPAVARAVDVLKEIRGHLESNAILVIGCFVPFDSWCIGIALNESLLRKIADANLAVTISYYIHTNEE